MQRLRISSTSHATQMAVPRCKWPGQTTTTRRAQQMCCQLHHLLSLSQPRPTQHMAAAPQTLGLQKLERQVSPVRGTTLTSVEPRKANHAWLCKN